MKNTFYMKHKNFRLAGVVLSAVLLLAACTKDLDRFPVNDLTPDKVYKDAAGYYGVAAKVYGAFALTGNSGPAGSGDVAGIDEGTSDFLRLFWKAQELPTDEAVVAWNDPGIQDFHNMNWSSSNPMLIGLYYRALYQITIANEFIRESADGKLSERGISGADAENIRRFRAEARYLRAFQYWVLMDLYGNPPFVTENDPIGVFYPKQISRGELFTYLETELKALETLLAAPRANEYGRADQAAAWALLARLYLNAEVYTGTAKNTEAVTYAKKVIDAGYTLSANYQNLMLADNHLQKNEFIFTINYDGIKTQNFGGTTFLVHAAVGDNMNPDNFGVNGGWFGIRTTKRLPGLFADPSGATDRRAQFVQNNLEINDLSKFADGWAVAKFKNIKSTGGPGSDPQKVFVDNDFPLFRLAEMYLIYAEATLRGGSGGSAAQALTYINALRTRAYNGSTAGNITAGQLNLDFVLDERGRELHWEGLRRTDLIRYKRFTEATYLWPWKGGVRDGRGVEAYRSLFPIPSAEILTNPNMKQNPNY
jgi:starch-binding outer membrane protein, SusD/RagB family